LINLSRVTSSCVAGPIVKMILVFCVFGFILDYRGILGSMFVG
jgi:hypothetical protein